MELIFDFKFWNRITYFVIHVINYACNHHFHSKSTLVFVSLHYDISFISFIFECPYCNTSIHKWKYSFHCDINRIVISFNTLFNSFIHRYISFNKTKLHKKESRVNWYIANNIKGKSLVYTLYIYIYFTCSTSK